MAGELVPKQNESLKGFFPNCEFVRTHLEGTHKARDYVRPDEEDGKKLVSVTGRTYKVTSDISLCKFCGNMEGSPNNRYFCPELARMVIEYEQKKTSSTPAISGLDRDTYQKLLGDGSESDRDKT